MKEELLRRMTDGGIVAIMRRTESSLAIETVDALYRGGVFVVEVTLNTDGALDMISALAGHFGDQVLVGAGTVMDVASAQAALDAGAKFIVAPHTDVAVIRFANEADRPVIPGAFTPTEIVHAWRAGADLVKVFPVGSVGPRYLRDVLAPLNDIPLLPTGGVTLDNAAEFIRSGARGLGLGSDLVNPKLVTARSFDAIADRARAFVSEVTRGRTS
ncbi:MAG TPA: bifunctional 4-hydroxy-2-oxoglutarate aldolase/2-dehydro-3-deoxy-phosphogluconate aldolase [Chloroflexota bacterium]|nr:bifunctional 4-hydroxy-2-oxoglutarate aldolase/2-dehydro-3-deoxy-phosphogluconate aldolase [Chloroflexota bacterium]